MGGVWHAQPGTGAGASTVLSQMGKLRHGAGQRTLPAPPLHVLPSPHTWLGGGFSPPRVCPRALQKRGSQVLGLDPAVPTGLTLFLPLARRGLRATAKITYQAVLLENLVRRYLLLLFVLCLGTRAGAQLCPASIC